MFITAEAYFKMAALLKIAHDKMDDYNARHNPERVVPFCMWCNAIGYDGFGLMHEPDCILVGIRKLIDV